MTLEGVRALLVGPLKKITFFVASLSHDKIILFKCVLDSVLDRAKRRHPLSPTQWGILPYYDFIEFIPLLFHTFHYFLLFKKYKTFSWRFNRNGNNNCGRIDNIFTRCGTQSLQALTREFPPIYQGLLREAATKSSSTNGQTIFRGVVGRPGQ